MKIITLENVGLTYESGEALQNVNLNINHGEFVFLVGPSGAGKSSVLKLIYFGDLPTKGHVRVGQLSSENVRRKDIAYLRRNLGIIFQDFRILEDRTVFENVSFALRVIGTRRNEIKKRVMRVLGDVGLSHKIHKMPEDLSGGEQQRVVIARAIANEPFILLADEPTGNLDPETADEIMAILERINVRGTAVLMATHNYALVEKHRHRVIRIDRGCTVN